MIPPGSYTHVLIWLPPSLLECGPGCGPEVGTGGWDLETEAEHRAQGPWHPGAETDVLHSPRSAPAAELGEWVAARLGYPVRLAPGAIRLRPGLRRLERLRTVPVFYVSPA
jgi:hypothetical protein